MDHVAADDHDECVSGTAASALLQHVEPCPREERRVAQKCKILEMIRIAVKSLHERSDRDYLATWFQNSEHFLNGGGWILKVFQNGFAINRINGRSRVRENMGIGDHIHVGKRSDVQIRQIRVLPLWTATNR